MSHNWWTRKHLVLIAAIVSLACVLAAVGLTFSEPVPSAALGPDWQCSRLAFVFTTCSRVSHVGHAIVRVAREPVCRRPRTQARL